MSFDATSTIIVALTWGIALFDAYLLSRSPEDAARRNTTIAAVLAALAMTTLYPAVYLRLDRIMGIPNIARSVGNSFGIASAWAFIPVVARLARHGTVQRGVFGSVWFMFAAVGAMVWSYSHADTPVSDPYDFQERYGGLPAVAAARFVLFAYLGVIFARLLVLSLQNEVVVRTLPRRRDRVQARLQTTGWACAAAYALYQCLFLGLRASGIAPSLAYITPLGLGLITGGLLALASGIAFRAWAWYDRLRVYRRLAPLWADLRSIRPAGALVPSPVTPGAIGLLCRLDFYLYRRVIEVRDGLLLLRPLLDTGERESTAEAVAIARAIVTLRSGVGVLTVNTTELAVDEQLDGRARGELERLERLAVAYREVRDHMNQTERRSRRI